MKFHGTCHFHAGEVARGRKILAEEHPDEELSGSLCDICNSTCQFFDIVCDKCDVDWHAHCVGVTRELAERIDKWYCERCQAKDARLRTTFKDGQEAEEVANVATTPPPGPSRGKVQVQVPVFVKVNANPTKSRCERPGIANCKRQV